jgi:hypothetical protein
VRVKIRIFCVRRVREGFRVRVGGRRVEQGEKFFFGGGFVGGDPEGGGIVGVVAGESVFNEVVLEG